MNTSSTGVASIQGPGEYGEEGVGNSVAPYREVTREGAFPSDNMGPGRSQGEVPGAGSMYAAVLSERPNISNLRNLGPSRAPSRTASVPIPVVEQANRNTGRF